MSAKETTSSFPGLPSKLVAPTKKSLFERQKAETEAKRAREKAETAAVYEDFVKSFDDEGGDAPARDPAAGRYGANIAFSGSGGAPGKRHFTNNSLKSGPGSLGPSASAARSGPGSLGPLQQSYSKKRPYDDFQGQRRERDRNHGMFSYEDDKPSSVPSDVASVFKTEEEEEQKGTPAEKAAAKPTIHLSSLPPGTSPAVIKALIPNSVLKVENVRILPPSAPIGPNAPSTERKSVSAIVTLAADTPAADIDTVVSQLQNQYLGFGFNLNISRHLSSKALGSSTSNLSIYSVGSTNLPFGARLVPQHTSLSRAPPPGHGRGFAPPSSYTSSTPYGSQRQPATQVIIKPPSDLKQLQLIHKTLEALLTHGPEFEALLMSRPMVQRDDKWSWLWNPRSAGGTYYRWRLWDILTNSSNRERNSGSRVGLRDGNEVVFENGSPWVMPEQNLRFEYTTHIDDFVSDPDYDSSDEEDAYDDYHTRRHNDHNMTGGQPPVGIAETNDGVGYLNPLAKAKLVHLLTRLPETNAKLRRGDVARVTAFTIEHAGAGADEVVDLVTANVLRPLFHATTNKDRADDQILEEGGEDIPIEDKKEQGQEKLDTTPASLVGLFVISDILSSSASCGVRHAWRYRSLFETSLKKHKVFETLGRVDKEFGWGRLKGEKWKRSIQGILSLWEGQSCFQHDSQEFFVQSFLSPPLTEREKEIQEMEEKVRKEREEEESRKRTSKWKSVDEEESAGAGTSTSIGAMEFGKRNARDDDFMQDVDVDGTPMSDEQDDKNDLDGDAMDEDDNDGGFEDEDLDGAPMVDSSDEDMEQEGPKPDTQAVGVGSGIVTMEGKPEEHDRPKSPLPRRQRPKAVDMFADDDSGPD